MLFKICTNWYNAYQKNLLYEDYLKCAARVADLLLSRSHDTELLQEAASSFHVYGKLHRLCLRQWMTEKYISRIFSAGKLTVRYSVKSIALVKYNLDSVDENIFAQLDKYFDWVAHKLGSIHYVPVIEAINKLNSMIQEETNETN